MPVSTIPSTRTRRIGRAPDSDVVIDLPMISWEHARIVEENGEFFIEDLQSRNGTALNQLNNRITRSRITASDSVYLGSLKVPATRLLGISNTAIGAATAQPVDLQEQSVIIGRDPECGEPLDDPLASWNHAKITRSGNAVFIEDLSSRNGTFVDGVRITSKTELRLGEEVGIGGFQFRLVENGKLERREYHGNVSISAVGVCVAVGGKRLLDPISLTVYPSELVALMGPAGAGKTTFLKALNGYTPPEAGNVLFNGTDLYQSYDLFRQQMGYVPQDDIVHSQLTVREALYFSTKLRTDLNDKEIDARIDKILDDLGILDKKDTLIGSPEKKVLSGGQRKRVNIAMELITDTPVLFLDEPTSGLSSYDAEGVVDLLKRLAGGGKTIITTIHQPSIDVYRKFDNLIMISRDRGGCGSLAYYGPTFPDSIEFFHPPAQQQTDKSTLNPEMLLTGLAKQPTAEWVKRYGQSKYRKLFVEDRSGKVKGEGSQKEVSATRSFGIAQWWTLFRRNIVLRTRDRAQLIITLLQAPLFAVLIALVFGTVKEPDNLSKVLSAPAQQAAVSLAQAQRDFSELSGNLAGIQFLLVVAAIWFGCNNAARDVVGEWSIYQRERMVNLKLPSYVFSKFAVLMGLCIFQCLTLLTVVYFGCDLHGSYLREAGILVISSLVGAALGLAISARSATTETAIALLPVVLLPVITLGGGIRAIYKMPAPARVMSYVAPSRWAFERNMIEEAKDHVCGYLPGPQRWDACPGGGKGVDAATLQVPEATSESNDIRQPAQLTNGAGLRYTYGESIGVLGGMLVVLLGSVLLFLRMRDIL
ncbi:ABC-type multidrug transport system ATPase subunit [Granulicella aggregans]|uniref:ABC-type multidrug transport system ATPase subunit n=1 Tax=Granulicella aggregans TaxID=474949 RepID=A0A7W7ZB28_9BACT|nr:ATP-binding cassette domain-containing protein [Granulicella aggregans]MBB5056610.1 ABC-type multidrug transport system ATPase subunit [Granulicella aggregans]